MFFDKKVHIAAHSVETVCAESENTFGGVKAFAGMQQPFKLKRIDTGLNSQQTVGGNFAFFKVIAGINKVKAVAFAFGLGAYAVFDGEERIVAV